MESKIEKYAALGYTPQRVAVLCGVTHSGMTLFMRRISTVGDSYHSSYELGRATGDKAIDSTLRELAAEGDVDAAAELEKRIKAHKIADLKKKLFGI